MAAAPGNGVTSPGPKPANPFNVETQVSQPHRHKGGVVGTRGKGRPMVWISLKDVDHWLAGQVTIQQAKARATKGAFISEAWPEEFRQL